MLCEKTDDKIISVVDEGPQNPNQDNNMDRFDVLNKIGHGTYGCVFKARRKEEHQVVSVSANS